MEHNITSCFMCQAVQRDKISTEFLHITGKIEEALSKVSYNRLDLSEEVQEQVILLIWNFWFPCDTMIDF